MAAWRPARLHGDQPAAWAMLQVACRAMLAPQAVWSRLYWAWLASGELLLLHLLLAATHWPGQHLGSWPPGINVYRHVCTMYVQCMYNAIGQQLTDMVYTILEKHKHVHTCIYISFKLNVQTRMYMVRTWYVHSAWHTCMYIVQTGMYIMMFILLCSRFESYKHVHAKYKPVHWV